MEAPPGYKRLKGTSPAEAAQPKEVSTAAQVNELFRKFEADATPYLGHPTSCNEPPARSYRLTHRKEAIAGCFLHGSASKHLSTKYKELQRLTSAFNDNTRKREHATPHGSSAVPKVATYTLDTPSASARPPEVKEVEATHGDANDPYYHLQTFKRGLLASKPSLKCAV